MFSKFVSPKLGQETNRLLCAVGVRRKRAHEQRDAPHGESGRIGKEG